MKSPARQFGLTTLPTTDRSRRLLGTGSPVGNGSKMTSTCPLSHTGQGEGEEKPEVIFERTLS